MAPRKTADDHLFESDVTGSQHLRNQLLAEYAPEIGPQARRKARPLKSTEIIAQARGHSTATLLDTQPQRGTSARAREKARIGWNKGVEQRAKAFVRRNGTVIQTGKATSAPSHLAKNGLQAYDIWHSSDKDSEANPTDDKALINPLVKPKAPKSMNQHSIFSTIPKEFLPQAIPTPASGHSYNPSHADHQALLGHALKEAQLDEAQSAKTSALRAVFEQARTNRNGKEIWQLAEEDVDCKIGEEAEELDAESQSAIPKRHPTKRKTSKEKAKRRTNLWLEREALKARKILKAQQKDISTLPGVLKAITQQPLLTASTNRAQQLALAQRIHQQGLGGMRSGSRRKVPVPKAAFQLEEELADSLRSLKPEGNLWRDWMSSKERRGQMEVSASIDEVAKQKKRKSRGVKMVERYDFKRFE